MVGSPLARCSLLSGPSLIHYRIGVGCRSTPRPPQHRRHVHQLARDPVAQIHACRGGDKAVGGEGGEGRDDGLCCLRELEVVFITEVGDLDQ